ncbi:amidoligase family protein [Marinobacter salinisoli]|uniref:Amidoligase family protein n=1 Tax=Marinobacter salinisoli TaxID=2769486 RepID=A0ABX7MQ35_9GAMM|nr:amidoligase family protein [Marinobacter salinisoli]QSP94420.1 amidoligase family protein [Marinobacter salinisoli]
MDHRNACLMPDIMHTSDQKERRVGIELELSGLSYDQLVFIVADFLGTKPRLESRYVTKLETDLGEFTVELDSELVKDLDFSDAGLPDSIRELGGQALEVIDAAAERIVPLEIITPPLPFSEVEQIESLVNTLREHGALGSRESIYYAFGLQLNPELPDLKPATVVRYLQAFAGLYEWLKSRHQLDISRKMTTYIEPWSSRYTTRLMEDDYEPDQAELLHDYLKYNPTRNRALDLLPLFAHLDSSLLGEYVQDTRIKSRPTLHYRLPDCDIDNPSWRFADVWNDWVVLEQIASNAHQLADLRARYREAQKLNLHNLTHSWLDSSSEWLQSLGYA